MTVITSKVCVVGDFAVGKTSLSERFVNNHFSDRYLSTVGVKIDTKEVELTHLDVVQKLVIWDVAGTDRFGATELAYLRGASGYLYVADGTRPETIDSAIALCKQVEDQYGAQPAILLLNKHDLAEQWAVADDRQADLAAQFANVFLTSARTGSEVENAFRTLAEAITQWDLSRKS